MPDITDEGLGRNLYDSAAVTIDAYRQQIELICPELVGRTYTDYPDQNQITVKPPQLTIMNSLTVTHHKLGGTKKVNRTLDPSGTTWTQVSRTAYDRIIFQMDLWALNATQRGAIHAAIMGQFAPYWILEIGTDGAEAVMVIQHYRPIRDGRKDSIARFIYQGFILTPELVKETLYQVKDIYVGVGLLLDKGPMLPPVTHPVVHFYDLPDITS
jgi:hypothetical protein